jgi:elongation factor Ts
MKELVKKLREVTKAGMQDCVNALKESQNDFDKAVDIIKIKGLNITSDNKVAAEGLVFIKVDKTKSTLFEFSCQTDFVANSEEFKAFATKAMDLFDTESFQQDLDLLQQDIKFKTKESCSLKRFKSFDLKDNFVTGYVHNNNKIGVLVKSTNSVENMEDIAMQIAAMNPLAFSREDLSEEVINKQKNIFIEQAKFLNKPQAALDKIVEGKLNKWFAEVCLVDQKLLTNGLLIKNLVKDSKLEFVRFEVGEGLVNKTNYLEDISKLL